MNYSVVEIHPYLSHFDLSKQYKYLIIGTFPPNVECRIDKNVFVNYFYGNKGSLWNIIDKVYPSYRLLEQPLDKRLEIIQRWQEDYSIGISDTLAKCRRKDLHSSNDSDLVFDHADLNNDLKKYIINNIDYINKLFFTSSDGENSAFSIFRQLMGPDLSKINQNKLEINLVSPSNATNLSLLNKPSPETLGLEKGLFEYISKERLDLLTWFEKRWEKKTIKKSSPKAVRDSIVIPSISKGLLIDYKIWNYKKVLPI